MEKVFVVRDNASGECCSFSTQGFTEDELKTIGKFGKVLSKEIGTSIEIGTEDEFYE